MYEMLEVNNTDGIKGHGQEVSSSLKYMKL